MSRLALFLLSLALAWPALSAAQTAEPRYGALLESELTALGFQPQCEPRGASALDCSYPARSTLERTDLTAHAHYDDTTDTVYMYVTLLRIVDTARALPALLRRAMELNWELLGAKVEWSAQSGELRLSSLLHTDSNFDRRAFRSLVRTLDRLTVRYHLELSHLAASAN